MKYVRMNFNTSFLLLFSSLSFSHAADFDQFGGYTGIQGKKAGHWHLEKIHGGIARLAGAVI